MKSFLTNCTQRGVVDGYAIDITSGIPQGTVLGPVLFIMFIDDIANKVNSQIRLFADDCIF